METVCVALKNECVPAWHPVHAELVLGNAYRLLGIVPSDEEWEFQLGDVVHCERRILAGSTELVVVSVLPPNHSLEADVPDGPRPQLKR